MRKATEEEINAFIEYRVNHVALVQKLGRVAFNIDISDHDHDKIEAVGDKLNQYALRNAMINHKYRPLEEDRKILDNLVWEHVHTQPHHPEYYCKEVTKRNFDDENPPQCKPTRMPKFRLLEMCCDWTAVALKTNKPLMQWFNKTCIGENPRFVFTENQLSFIRQSLKKLYLVVNKYDIHFPNKEYTAKNNINDFKESVNFINKIQSLKECKSVETYSFRTKEDTNKFIYTIPSIYEYIDRVSDTSLKIFWEDNLDKNEFFENIKENSLSLIQNFSEEVSSASFSGYAPDNAIKIINLSKEEDEIKES